MPCSLVQTGRNVSVQRVAFIFRTDLTEVRMYLPNYTNKIYRCISAVRYDKKKGVTYLRYQADNA